jgi:hypothetical protein
VKSTPETRPKTASDLTPQIAARAYELYERQGHLHLGKRNAVNDDQKREFYNNS